MFKTWICFLLCDLVMPQMRMAPYHCVCLLLLLSLVHLAFSQNDTVRIVHGEKVIQGEFPFVVSIHDAKLRLVCTASILNDNTILTAAHCLRGRTARQLLVYLGHVDLSGRRTKRKYVHKVKHALMHPNFTTLYIGSGRNSADLGLLKLEKSIRHTRFTRQVCLPTEESQPDLENCVAMGWGRLAHDKGKMPSILQKIQMKLTKNCRELGDPKGVFCAVGAKGKGGTCYGDSGGPLICSVKGNPGLWLQYGVCSYSDDFTCRGASYYMKVSQYLAWIQKVAQD